VTFIQVIGVNLQADEHDRKLKIGARPRGIARKNPQPASIGVHFGSNRNFHREVGNVCAGQEWFD